MKFNLTDTKTFLNKEKYDFLSQFLSKCPSHILNTMQLCFFETNQIIMYTGDTSEFVYILLKGGVDGVDESVPNIPYTFTEIQPIDVLGDYELFNDAPGRYVSLRATGKTTCIRLRSKHYLSWMKQDNNALFIRMQLLLKVLTWETQFHRQYLFLDNDTRLILFLVEECKKNAHSYPHKVQVPREVIVSKIGCSIRTLNRTIQNLEEQSLVSRSRGKIVVSEKQHKKLKQFIIEQEENMNLTLPRL